MVKHFFEHMRHAISDFENHLHNAKTRIDDFGLQHKQHKHNHIDIIGDVISEIQTQIQTSTVHQLIITIITILKWHTQCIQHYNMRTRCRIWRF